jgi:hypothetical protein
MSLIDIRKLPCILDPRMLGKFGFCVVCNNCDIIADLRHLCNKCSNMEYKTEKYICTVHGYINCTGKNCQPFSS